MELTKHRKVASKDNKDQLDLREAAKKDLELNWIETDWIGCFDRAIGRTAIIMPVVPQCGRTVVKLPVVPIVLGLQGLIKELSWELKLMQMIPSFKLK